MSITNTFPYLYQGLTVNLAGRAGVYEVTKTPPRNGVNVTLRDENGRVVKAHMSYVTVTQEKFELKVDDILTHLFLGVKVRVKSPKFPGVYVVIAKKGGVIHVAKLGGDNDRYVKVSPSNLELAE